MHRWLNLFNRRWWRFECRYWRRKTPWDTHITPPEVMAFIEQTPPGRALDIGCGTGTNAITLTRHGWRVTAVDFSVKAIGSARRKAAAAGIDVDFRLADASDLSELNGPFDYALDIGCLFTLAPESRQRCVSGVAKLLASGGRYMLYAWLPGPMGARSMGLAPEEVGALTGPCFKQDAMAVGKDGDRASAWYWFTRV
jgi:2-polyprenyl-3-methyl-5-hydroxy-6-metoxy-1,4-benzoquinol methylase